MKLSKALAIKLLQLYKGEKMPASSLNYPLVKELMADGIIADNRAGRSKSLLYVPLPATLQAFLLNRFSIKDLDSYITLLNTKELSRAILVQTASDSKIKRVRTFKGFLVNSYEPISATLNGQNIIIHPTPGTFQFIHSIESFVPHSNITIVGVENSENFSQINKQQQLFENINALFVCRYPLNQSKDLIKWLQAIPNRYIHFGDFDFAGIGIYLNEYKTHLGNRATFFVPNNLGSLITKFGSKRLYDIQKMNFKIDQINEQGLSQTIELLHKHKKGLEQEALIV